ncbi:hypothetical protein BT63DRAFT_482177 [Microthyrium microscopicum]|uniref:C4-dicarboxylate transporter/malic acid transport protein n=1 Tax=Microthyrium microscopicum TaxID=703497 RepID=A0A6A6U3C2_9PEZI|nr:hypothetical protein BT63DRAFT_482177 [Microthyrium microscopicum]
MAPRSETSSKAEDIERFSKENPQDEPDIESISTPQPSRLSSAIQTFSPNWYAICMNTGLLGTLLHQFPYKFHGSDTISTCFWVLNIALFILFTTIQIIRHILFPKAALRQTLATMDELCFWGCVPIALVTIIAQTALNGSNTSSWGEKAQHNFTVLAFVLWWIDVAIMLVVAWVAYYLIAKRRMAADIPIPSFIFLPAVGTTTVGLVGGIIANYSYGASARLAVPVVLVSYLLEGFGWWLAILIYPVFLGELWSKGLPIPFRMPTLMMLVGPAGQTAAALNVLSSAAIKHFGNYDKGTFLTVESAKTLQGGSMGLALLFLGFDIFWAIFVIVALAEAGWKKQLKLGMPWWSTIFPIGTMNTTFLVMGQELDSPTFRVLATGLYLILLIDYLCCWVMTGYLVYKGQLLDGRQQLRKKD